MAEGIQNAFPQNFSRPSINSFDFKDYIASIESIPKEYIFKQPAQPYVKNMVECKIENEQQENSRKRGVCAMNA